MNNRKTINSGVGGLLVIALGVLALAGLLWANMNFVRQNPGGNDFLPRWVGTRAFLLEGLSPYSDEVALRIQRQAYGRPAQTGEDEMRMAYPLYSTLIFAPFAIIQDYEWARAVWMTVLEIGLILLLLSSFSLVRWRPRTPLFLLLVLFTLFWYHSIRPLINGNVVILVALVMTFALLAVQRGWDEVAGVFLAFATIKPQLSLLLIAFIVVWAAINHRGRVVVSMLITLSVLVLGAMVFIPDWPLQNLYDVFRYPGYTPPGTLGAALYAMLPGVGRQLGWGITIALIGLIIFEWRRGANPDPAHFVWTACLTLVVSQWIGIQTDPGNFIILLPPLILVVAVWVTRWGQLGRVTALVSLLVLFIGLWALFLGTVEQGAQPQQHPIMFLPLPLFLLLGLYWTRHWAIRAPLVVERLSSYDQ